MADIDDVKAGEEKTSTPPKMHPAHRKKITFNLRFTLALIVGFAVFGIGVHFLHAFQVDRNATKLLDRSHAALEKGEIDEAIRFLRSYIGFRPQDADAVAELAQLLDRRARSGGELMQTYFTYEEALRRNPTRSDLRRRAAEIAFRLGRFTDSLNQIKVLEKNGESDADLSLLAARCYIGEDEIRLAIVKYLKTLEQRDSTVGAYSQLAELFRQRYEDLPKQHELTEIKNSKPLVELFPLKRELIAGITDEKILSQQERIDVLLQRMIEHGEPKFEAYLERGRARIRAGQLDLAEADIQEALSMDATAKDVVLAAADLAVMQASAATEVENEEKSADLLNKAVTLAQGGLELETTTPAFYLTLFRAEQMRGNFSAAQKYLENGLQAIPQALISASLDDRGDFQALQPQFSTTLADFLITQSQRVDSHDESESLLSQATELIKQHKRDFAPSWQTDYLEGRIDLVKEQWSEAIPRLERARRFLISSVELRRSIDLSLGACYQKLNNPDRRVVVYRRALEDDPFWTIARLEMARALVDAGRINDAINEYGLLSGIPSAPLELARILLLQELKKPEANRSWSLIESAIRAETELRRREELPPSPGVDVLQAEILWHQGKTEEAKKLIAKSRIDHPDSASVVATEMRLILSDPNVEDAERTRQAQKVLNAAKQDLGDRFDLRMSEAMLCSKLPPEEADKLLDQLSLNLDDYSDEQRIELYRRIAQVYLSIGKPEKAKAVWKTLAEGSDAPVMARLALIELARRSGEAAEIDEQLKFITEIEGEAGPYGNVVKVQQILSGIDLKVGESLTDPQKQLLNQCRDLLQQAQSQRTSWTYVERLLGDVERLLGNKEVAVEHYRRAIDQGDRTQAIVSYVVDALYEQKRFPEADRILNQLSEETPEVLSGDLARLAWKVAWQQREYDQALGLAGNAAQDSTNYQDYIWLSRLQFAKGERGESVETPLRTATERFPKEPEVWLAYVSYLARVDRVDDAKKELEVAKTILPKDPPHLIPLTLGKGYETLKLLDEAEANYKAALNTDVDNALFQVQLADFYTRHNNFEKASPLLEALIRSDSKTPAELRDWAMRRRTQIAAMTGTYADVDAALKLLDKNQAEGKTLSLYDLRTKLQILSRRNTKKDKRELLATLKEIQQRGAATGLERLQLAMLYNDLEDWEQSVATFEELVKDNPQASSAMIEYSNALVKHGEIKKAREWYERASAFASNSLSLVLLNVRILSAQNDSDGAHKVMDQFLENRSQQNDETILLKDMLNFPEGRALLDEFRKEIVESDDKLAFNIQEGVRFLQEGQFDEASASLKPLVTDSKFQDRIQAFYLKTASQIFDEIDDEAQAETYLRAAIERVSTTQDQVRLISLLARQKKVTEALELSKKAIWGTLSATQAAQIDIAAIRSGKGTSRNIKEVETRILAALEAEPDSTTLARHLADLKDLNGDHQQAIMLYQKVLAQNRKDIIALNNMAYLSVLTGGDTNIALDAVNSAIEMAGPIGALLDTRGVVYLKRKEYDRAIIDLQRANDESPSASTQFRLSQAYWKKGDKESARRVFKSAEAAGLSADTVHALEKQEFESFVSEIEQAS